MLRLSRTPPQTPFRSGRSHGIDELQYLANSHKQYLVRSPSSSVTFSIPSPCFFSLATVSIFYPLPTTFSCRSIIQLAKDHRESLNYRSAKFEFCRINPHHGIEQHLEEQYFPADNGPIWQVEEPLRSELRRVVFIDSAWKKSHALVLDPALAALPKVTACASANSTFIRARGRHHFFAEPFVQEGISTK